jgi:tetratricopeptide (TPR) repeat protein
MRTALVTVALTLVLSVTLDAQTCAENAREVAPILSENIRTEYDNRLTEAKTAFAAKPQDADAIIWLGRRTAYLGNYKNAIRIFTDGIAIHPNDARFFRHRGHRYLTLRCIDDAIADFERAAKLIKGKQDEIEPDGLPNAKNIPTSTLQSNIWYHLGLAYYLKGDFANALRAYRAAEKVSKNNDMRVATAYWHYMTLRRMGKDKEARRVIEPFAGEVELIENTEYLRLVKLNRGEAKAEELLASIQGDATTLGSASLGYGIGNYFLYNGDREKARTIFQKIVAGNQWSSFGYIAAEAELKR